MTEPMLEGVHACVFDAYGTLFDYASAAARCGDVCGVRADKIGGLARGWTLAVECLRSGWCEDNRGSTVTAS